MSDANREITEYEKFSKDAGSTYILKVGSQIKVLPDMEPYEVTEMQTDKMPPRLTLTYQSDKLQYNYTDEKKVKHTAILPRTIVMEGTKRFSVGRNPDSDGVITASNVSRPHFTVHFEPQNKQFIMTATNKNSGKIRYVTERGFEAAANITHAAETLADFKVPGSEEDKEVALRPGMTLQILPSNKGYSAIPTYMVKTAVSGVKPELVLEMMGDTAGYSKAARITLTGKDASKSIGSVAGNDYVIQHPKVSRLHASIFWDEGQKSWTYHTVNTPPVVGIGNQFLNDMQQKCDALGDVNPNAARKEIMEIDELIADMQQFRSRMENVQKLEAATINTPPSERERGGNTEDSQRGYRNWLHAYKLLYQDELNARDTAAIDKGMHAMEVMAKDREIMRDIESYADFPKGLAAQADKIVAACRKANYNKDMVEIVGRQCAPLNEQPPEASFIVSGYKGHHTVTKIEKEAKGYLVTTYNAGAECKFTPDGSGVMAKYQQHLNPKVKVEDFIRLLDERKIRRPGQGDSDKIDAAIEASAGKVEAFTVAPPQHKGNCTTRSTREMLKDMLEPERFAHIHRHVSNPDICDPAEVMAALQMRRDALAKFSKVEKPKGQADWVHSISDLRVARGDNIADSLSRNSGIIAL